MVLGSGAWVDDDQMPGASDTAAKLVGEAMTSMTLHFMVSVQTAVTPVLENIARLPINQFRFHCTIFPIESVTTPNAEDVVFSGVKVKLPSSKLNPNGVKNPEEFGANGFNTVKEPATAQSVGQANVPPN
jgi:hypothetical protein